MKNVALLILACTCGVVEADVSVLFTNDPIFEPTDSPSHGWAPITPGSRVQIDRFLYSATYRAQFSTEQSQMFLRVKEE